MTHRPWAPIVALLVFAVVGPAHALTIERVGDANPIVGNDAIVRVYGEGSADPIIGATVTATYYPGSSVEREASVGTTNAEGVAVFQPEYAGLVRVTASAPVAANVEGSGVAVAAERATTTLSVRYTGLPKAGVFVFAVALILLGGFVASGARG